VEFSGIFHWKLTIKKGEKKMEKEFTIYRNERNGMGNCFLVSFRDFWFMIDPGSVNPTTELGIETINSQQLPDFWNEVELSSVEDTPFVESTSLRTELVEIGMDVIEILESK
jgi:hypothetical protein